MEKTKEYTVKDVAGLEEQKIINTPINEISKAEILKVVSHTIEACFSQIETNKKILEGDVYELISFETDLTFHFNNPILSKVVGKIKL
jgi:hypothetical protein